MIQLREDQEDLRAKLRVALRSNASVLAFAPTGFGKTVLAASLIKSIFERGKRVIFGVHRVDLIRQTAKTFDKFGLPYSFIAAGHHYNPLHRIYIASIPTLRNRLGKIPAHYIMPDEAHLSMAAGWSAVMNHYRDTGTKAIGWTGSPERLDGKPLKDVWDVMVEGPSVRWLIENGHLSRYRAFAPAGVDLSGIHTRNGDYVTAEIDDLMSGKAVLKNAVRHWKKFAKGKRTIAFAPSVARAEQLAAEFRDNGVTAVALDGETPQHDRMAAFKGFAARQIDIIVNCQLFCEGFDLAAQVDDDVTVEAVLDYSPTQSLARHLQKYGRGLRKKPDDAILLDLVGGFARLGLPDEERQWSLEGRKKTECEVEVVVCPSCFAAHEAAPKCPYCDHVYERNKPDADGFGGRSLDEVDGELEEIDVEALRRQRKKEQSNAKSLDDLIALAKLRGYKQPENWAAHILTARADKRGEVAPEAERLGILSSRELSRRTGVHHATIDYWRKQGFVKARTYDAAVAEIEAEKNKRIVNCAEVAQMIGADRAVVARWARVEKMPLTGVDDALEWIKTNKPERVVENAA